MATTADEATEARRASPPGRARSGASEPRSEDAGDAPAHLGNTKENGVQTAPQVEGYVPDRVGRERVKDRCMRWLRTYSVRQGARDCMVAPVAAEVTITVDGTTGRGHVSGVKRCASPWACPTCSFRIRQRRAREVTELAEAAEARGHSALLVTLTVPHAAGEALGDLLDVLNGAQRRLWAGGWAERFRARWQIAGQVRAVETTWGARNGWGPHVHAVVILERDRLDNTEYVELNRPGFEGGSGYWFPTPVGAACWAA